MNITLTPELEQFVSEKVESSLYHTASEVIREGLRLMKERDHRLEDLGRDVRAGFDEDSRFPVLRNVSVFAPSPEAGTLRNEIELGLRGFPVGKYIVYYRQRGRYLLISRVIHGMREQKRAFFDED